MASTSTSTSTSPIKLKLFRIHVYYTLNQVHCSHGINHQDYEQYSNYCTAKVRRLRCIRDVRTTLLHNPKYVDGISAKSRQRKHSYCARQIPSPIEHENVLLTILYQSERAWSQACCKQQQQGSGGGGSNNNKNNNKKNRSSSSSSKKYVLRRLRKASKWANLLHEESKSCCCSRTILELQSYAAYMQGNVYLEQKKYLQAFESYKQSMNILLQLATEANANDVYDNDNAASSTSESSNSPGTLVLGDIWKTRAESVLRPLVRFCGYEAKDQIDPLELKEVVTVVSSTTKATAGGSSSSSATEGGSLVLNFRGKRIVLDAYKQIAVLYLKMEGNNTMIGGSSDDEEQFLQLLSDLDDASRLVQVELNRYYGGGGSETTAAVAGPAVTAKLEELGALQSYFQYQKLIVWRRRQENLVLPALNADDTEKIVHVYDTLQQNAESAANLLSGGAGGAGGSSSGGAAAAVETNIDSNNYEEDPLWLEAQADVIRIRAFRCYYLAKLYESEPTLHGSNAQVMALLKHSSKLSKRAQEEIAACYDDDDDDDEKAAAASSNNTLESLEDLDTKIGTMMCRMEATKLLAAAHTIGGGGGDTTSGGGGNTDRPLWLRLDDLDAGTSPTKTLADNPPLPIPMPCKPSFFDLAWQHVDTTMPLNEIGEYINNNSQGSTTKKQGGGGIFSGWFG